MEMKENPEEANPLYKNVTDAKSDPEKSKHPFKYLLELWSDSVVTGVAQIVTVGSVVRRVFKILVLSVCFGGFIYQAVQFMKLYQTYPSQLEIELKYVKDMIFPVITICNRNPVQKTKYCNDFPEKCAKPKNLTLFCSKYPHHCNQDTTLNDLQFVISDAPLYREGLEKYEQQVEDLICDCCLNFFTLKDMCLKMSKQVRYRNENLKQHTCYAVDFAKIGKRMNDVEVFTTNVLPTTARENNCSLLSAFAHEAKYTIVLGLDPKEYTRPDRTVAAQVVVHSQSDFKNPFEKGFMAKEGKRYKVSLQAFEEHLLPAPYSTNCTENDKLDEGYDREFCLLNCTVHYLAEKCHCVPSFLGLEIGVPNCDGIIEDIDCILQENEEFCFQRCPRPCFSSYLQYSVSESDIENNMANVDLGDGAIYNVSSISDEEVEAFGAFLNYIRKGKTVIDVVYDSKEVIVYKYTPKYEKIEILGYIGGFIGIWLGISLVAVIDFLESIVVFIVWSVHTTKKNRLNR